MTTEKSPIPLTIISADRAQLCDLSWTLSLFGYEVTASCDAGDEGPWRRAAEPQILLVDARSGDQAEELLAAPRSDAFVYRIAIQSTESENACERLLAMGADDVVRFPVNLGELLTRLRAGVRRLEFERRLAARQRRDPLTGAMTRPALLRWLEQRRAAGEAAPQSVVVCGVDFLSLIARQNGARAERRVAATLGRCLAQSLKPDERFALLRDGVFVALLSQTVDEAHAFADALSGRFAACDTMVREFSLLPSISAAIDSWSADAPATQQLEEAHATFEHLRSCGGNCVQRADELRRRIAAWRANIDQGVPFEDVVAQDLMEAFPIILTEQQAEATPPGGAAPADAPCVPVVNAEGRLVGVAAADRLGAPAAGASLAKPETIKHTQSLSELFDAFTLAPDGRLVVVDDDCRPLGYLSSEGLASLVLDRIDADRYRAPAGANDRLSSLVVPVEPTAAAEQPAVAT